MVANWVGHNPGLTRSRFSEFCEKDRQIKRREVTEGQVLREERRRNRTPAHWEIGVPWVSVPGRVSSVYLPFTE